jgi:hypothetical protein
MRGTAGPLPLAAAASTEPGAPTSRPAAQPAVAPGTETRTLSGTVRDEATQEPLPGATILLKGTQLGTTADMDGCFTLAVPGEAPTAQLVIVYIGYTTAEQTVALANRAPLAVLLSADGRMLSGDVVIVPAQRPWPWHPRRLYQWSKYWLGRPFRQ